MYFVSEVLKVLKLLATAIVKIVIPVAVELGELLPNSCLPPPACLLKFQSVLFAT